MHVCTVRVIREGIEVDTMREVMQCVFHEPHGVPRVVTAELHERAIKNAVIRQRSDIKR